MKKIFSILVCIILTLETVTTLATINPSSHIKYVLNGGRFGDNLLNLIHAKWVAYSLNIPMAYIPFQYSDHLQLSVDSTLISNAPEYPNHLILRDTRSYNELFRMVLSDRAELPTEITVNYYPESAYEYEIDQRNQWPPFTAINWQDPVFIKEVRSLLQPLVPIPSVDLPKDRITVALHLRTGVGYDGPSFKNNWPLKWCPLDYYVDAIQILWEYYRRPMYVYIFTDDPNPVQYQKLFSRNFLSYNILFDCRREGNAHNKNVVEDFFELGQFDCSDSF